MQRILLIRVGSKRDGFVVFEELQNLRRAVLGRRVDQEIAHFAFFNLTVQVELGEEQFQDVHVIV